MSCSYAAATIDQTIAFHGHRCPGLAIGIRAAEYATTEFPDALPAGLVCVTETDMCGVDAIQFLTGCTFGKGNLIHRDYGKVAFSFFNREDKKGIRLVLRDYPRGDNNGDMRALMAKGMEQPLTEEEQRCLEQLRENSIQLIMTLPLNELFSLERLNTPAPRSARIMSSMACSACGEKTMESRTRRFAGKILCIPCFKQIEQKQ